MSIQQDLAYPYKVESPINILTKISIECKSVSLKKKAMFEVLYLNQNGGTISHFELLMPPDDYVKWGDDDDYLFEWVRTQIPLKREDYIKYKYEGGSFCILNIEVDYLKSADVYVGLFDETDAFTGSQKIQMDKADYDIWVQSNEYLVVWAYNQLGKLPI